MTEFMGELKYKLAPVWVMGTKENPNGVITTVAVEGYGGLGFVWCYSYFDCSIERGSEILV